MIKSILPLIILISCIILYPGNNYALNQSDTTKVNALIDSSLNKNKSLDEVIKILEEDITLSDNLNYLKGKANVLHQLGIAYCKMGEYSKSLNYLFEELKLRENNPEWDILLLENNYSVIGEAFRAVGTYDLALENLNKSILEKNSLTAQGVIDYLNQYYLGRP